ATRREELPQDTNTPAGWASRGLSGGLPSRRILCGQQNLGAVPVTGLTSTLSTFPNYILYFVLGGALTALFVLIYVNLTPQRDIVLIRGGNSAAAIALVGGLLGFVVPLASVIAHSAAILDLIVWGIVALAIQLAGFL